MSIIENLNSAIEGASKAVSPDALTRDIGGYNRNNQPFIGGYFQVFFNLPNALFGESEAASRNWLHSSCESFTPHTQTMNKIDVIGQGQTGSSFVGSTTTTREITLTFREYQSLPILKVIRSWASVFDPHTGVSPLSGENFIPSNYKGAIYVVQTKPTVGDGGGSWGGFKPTDIEEIFAYDGAFPTTIPLDTLNSDITTNESVQHSVQFSFDGSPITTADNPDLASKIASIFEANYMKTFNDRKTNMDTAAGR